MGFEFVSVRFTKMLVHSSSIRLVLWRKIWLEKRQKLDYFSKNFDKRSLLFFEVRFRSEFVRNFFWIVRVWFVTFKISSFSNRLGNEPNKPEPNTKTNFHLHLSEVDCVPTVFRPHQIILDMFFYFSEKIFNSFQNRIEFKFRHPVLFILLISIQ